MLLDTTRLGAVLTGITISVRCAKISARNSRQRVYQGASIHNDPSILGKRAGKYIAMGVGVNLREPAPVAGAKECNWWPRRGFPNACNCRWVHEIPRSLGSFGQFVIAVRRGAPRCAAERHGAPGSARSSCTRALNLCG